MISLDHYIIVAVMISMFILYTCLLHYMKYVITTREVCNYITLYKIGLLLYHMKYVITSHYIK